MLALTLARKLARPRADKHPSRCSAVSAYPTEKEKSIFISTQWGMVTLGSAIGASVSFGISYHSTGDQGICEHGLRTASFKG